MNVEKGIIKNGQCFTDCLIPTFIDELNEILKSGEITYDEKGIQDLGKRLTLKFQDNEVVRDKYIPELISWMKSAI